MDKLSDLDLFTTVVELQYFCQVRIMSHYIVKYACWNLTLTIIEDMFRRINVELALIVTDI